MIAVGQTIGNYTITAELGEGGMGVVYLAEHPIIGRKVALKAIHPELSRNPEVVSRFETEARAVNQIGNEHIVDIHDFGRTSDGEYYFIMEYLQGESLADKLKRERFFPPARALQVAAQVADALAASHSHGIIHRDLKPENIFLCNNRGPGRDFVKVLDFGLAKLTQNEQKVTHKTRTGSVMGTPYYMSPEQCEGKIEIDHRADVYSLGVLLFEMLTGKVPFGGEGYGEIIVKHVTMPPPSTRSVVPELPDYLDLILFRALAKDRDQRFQTMSELRDALLDPERYLSSAPEIGIPDDLSGIARAAAPMSRSEMDVRASQLVGVGSGLDRDGSSADIPSTFREGRGELIENLIPKRRSSQAILFVGIAALVGAAVVLFGPRREPRHPLPQATLPLHPSSVRVNFNSDPDGAVITRGDGKTLGLTPLSIEVPYSDSAVEFMFKKSGYESKTMYVVPNLPSPLFATLRRIEIEPEAAAAPAHKPAPPTGGVRRVRDKTTSTVPQQPQQPQRPEKVDEDGVLEPSFR